MDIREARKVTRPVIKVGESYTFYCEMQQEYEPPEKRLRRFTGQAVTVLHHRTWEGANFTVKAEDGTKFIAHEEELNDWDKDLGQFYWPDGTYGPDHDTTYLVNERDNKETA
jgi:hypothetical protein